MMNTCTIYLFDRWALSNIHTKKMQCIYLYHEKESIAREHDTITDVSTYMHEHSPETPLTTHPCSPGDPTLHIWDSDQPAFVAYVDTVSVRVDEQTVSEEVGAPVADQAASHHLFHTQTTVFDTIWQWYGTTVSMWCLWRCRKTLCLRWLVLRSLVGIPEKSPDLVYTSCASRSCPSSNNSFSMDI